MRVYAVNILNKTEEYKQNPDCLADDIYQIFSVTQKTSGEYFKKDDFDESIERIREMLDVSDDTLFQFVINKNFEAEFNGQLLNIYSGSKGIISLKLKDNEILLNVSENIVSAQKEAYFIQTEAVYIDDPFLLDDMEGNHIRHRNKYVDHRMHLSEKLSSENNDASAIEQIIAEKKFEKIYDRISSVCEGSIVRQKNNRWEYQLRDTDQTLHVKNLSTGLKTFVILKTLITNGVIEKNGTIILDEPEIHLHPEW